MSLIDNVKYQFMKDIGAPALMALDDAAKKRRGKKRPPNPNFNPPPKAAGQLKEMMMRHYFLARYAKGARPVAWVASGAPVELLRAFDFYTVYPENHGALCGASKMGAELCGYAEERGYNQDLCSYARIDLGVLFSGKTPAGRLPKPDLLFCSNNICQTVSYWYKALAHYLKIPLINFDTPYNFEEITDEDIAYMVKQLEEMIPVCERVSGKKFNYKRFVEAVERGRRSSEMWGQVLDTMKAKPAPLTIFDAFGHLAPVVSLRGLEVCERYYEVLLAELQERVRQGIGALKNERKRLMWDNIAIWFKVRELAEMFAERGMNFVCATYTNAWSESTRFMSDTSNPWEATARTYSLVILNNNLNHRLKLMEQLIGDYSVDGLLIHSARSCKPYSVGQYDLKRLLMERLDVPSVVIEADITDSRVWSEEQARTRLEAFFEALEARGQEAA